MLYTCLNHRINLFHPVGSLLLLPPASPLNNAELPCVVTADFSSIEGRLSLLAPTHSSYKLVAFRSRVSVLPYRNTHLWSCMYQVDGSCKRLHLQSINRQLSNWLIARFERAYSERFYEAVWISPFYRLTVRYCFLHCHQPVQGCICSDGLYSNPPGTSPGRAWCTLLKGAHHVSPFHSRCQSIHPFYPPRRYSYPSFQSSKTDRSPCWP